MEVLEELVNLGIDGLINSGGVDDWIRREFRDVF